MPSLPLAPTQFALTPQTRTPSTSTTGLTPSSTAGVNPLTPVVNRNAVPTATSQQVNPGGATGIAPIVKPPAPTGGGASLQSNTGANDPGFGAGLNGTGFGPMSDQDRAFLWYMNNQYRNDLSNQPGAHQMFFDMFGNGKNNTQVNQLINDIGYNHLMPGKSFNINNYTGQFRDRYNQLVQQHGGQLNQYGHNAYMDNVVRQDAINRLGPNAIDFSTGQKVSAGGSPGSTPASNAGVPSDPNNPYGGQYTGFGGINYSATPSSPTTPPTTTPAPVTTAPSPVPAGTTPSAVPPPSTTPGMYAGTALGGSPKPIAPVRTPQTNVAPPSAFPTPSPTAATRPVAGIGRWNTLTSARA